jgi:hypothetical protein
MMNQKGNVGSFQRESRAGEPQTRGVEDRLGLLAPFPSAGCSLASHLDERRCHLHRALD